MHARSQAIMRRSVGCLVGTQVAGAAQIAPRTQASMHSSAIRSPSKLRKDNRISFARSLFRYTKYPRRPRVSTSTLARHAATITSLLSDSTTIIIRISSQRVTFCAVWFHPVSTATSSSYSPVNWVRSADTSAAYELEPPLPVPSQRTGSNCLLNRNTSGTRVWAMGRLSTSNASRRTRMGVPVRALCVPPSTQVSVFLHEIIASTVV